MFLQPPRSFANCAAMAVRVFLISVAQLRIEEKLCVRRATLSGPES
jgi:hypothetical protein